MQVEIFTLCDSAHVYAGRAVVMGSFNQVIAKQLPVQLNMILTIRIAFEKKEAGDKVFFFTINNPDGSLLMPELRCDVKQTIPKEKLGPLTTFDLNIGLGTIFFSQFGLHTITMKCEDKVFELKFLVQEGKGS